MRAVRWAASPAARVGALVSPIAWLVSCIACQGSKPEAEARQEGTSPETPAALVQRSLPAPDRGRPACPADMVLVDGLFCPEVEQRCLQYEPGSRDDLDRCLNYERPTRCKTDHRVLLRFCIDRYEWPNRLGQKPLVLVTWREAQEHCAAVGKRLCDEQEWLFACEGEGMLPYVHGYDRDPTKCVMDRLYVERTHSFDRYDSCMDSEVCRAEFDKIDQREAAGAFKQCASPFGAYDMNGNVNEWINIPGESYPKRSGLKGGWWGPVRNRCRPTVRFHNEEDWGYEVGFRCCQNAVP